MLPQDAEVFPVKELELLLKKMLSFSVDLNEHFLAVCRLVLRLGSSENDNVQDLLNEMKAEHGKIEELVAKGDGVGLVIPIIKMFANTSHMEKY
jgi:hypothetical protein